MIKGLFAVTDGYNIPRPKLGIFAIHLQKFIPTGCIHTVGVITVTIRILQRAALDADLHLLTILLNHRPHHFLVMDASDDPAADVMLSGSSFQLFQPTKNHRDLLQPLDDMKCVLKDEFAGIFLDRFIGMIDAADKLIGTHVLNLEVGASEAESRNAEVSLRLKEALGEAVDIEDAQNEIDLYREEAFIHEFCDSMCGILGCSSSEELRPALAYAPEDIDFAELDQLRNRLMKQLKENNSASLRITDVHRELVSVLLQAQPILVHVIEENSLFALSAMNCSFDKKWKPEVYVDRLNTLVQKDYDPFFGEAPEDFIETFSKATSAMITFISGLPEKADSELFCLSVDEIERRVRQKKHEMIEEYKVECAAVPNP